MIWRGFLLRNLFILSLPCVAVSLASSSLHLPLAALDPSNIPEHVDMSSYPSPMSSPSESPWGSNSNLRRSQLTTTGATQREVWTGRRELKAPRLRRTVSIPQEMVEKPLDGGYEAAHCTDRSGLKRMEHEYRRVADPAQLRAKEPVYTQLQQSLYPELRF